MLDLKATADYFQKQADRARDPDRKKHYQQYADKYRDRAVTASAETADSVQEARRQ